VQVADVDDIVQEVAIRALREQFDTPDHMVRWCCRVAINLHIDSTRRVRRISSEPLVEHVAPHNVPETVERRLALDAVLAQMAGLSKDDQALLLQLPPTDSRKEAVRLAVRRHRLRARLAALVEGVLAGVPGLRRILHSESLPVRVAVVAVPVIAVLTVLPFVATLPPGSSTVDQPNRGTLVQSRTPAARNAKQTVVPSTAVPLQGRAGATSPASSSRTIMELHPAGNTVGVRQDPAPPDAKTFCLSGYVNLCVDRPGPDIPIPPLPLPAAPGHAS
jgi:hypothetical protein